MRILALDYGEKRVGVAITDPLGIFAQPLDVIIHAKWESLVSSIFNLIESYNVERLVIGLPLDADGREGHKAKEIRRLKDRIARELKRRRKDVDIVLWDESFSTKDAERFLADKLSCTKKQRIIDKMAATFILDSYLRSLE